MKTINLITMTLILTSLASCGGGGGGGGSQQQQEAWSGEAAAGTYHAHLRPLNGHVNGFLPHGGATVKINGNTMEVKTYLDDDAAVTHRQSIRYGSRCPSDLNGDGIIDYPESLATSGKVMIPLDNDLSSQDSGAEVYPRGSAFTYVRKAQVEDLLSDLWGPDANASDDTTKISTGESLNLIGKVVIIHGTRPRVALPSTVIGREGEAANLSLPVACGVIGKVE